MTTSTVATDSPLDASEVRGSPHWLTTLLTYVLALSLVAVALYFRIHNLGLLYDRDGYDEGVYWQSLRSMSAGYALYSQVFYSQPPFFLLSIFPTYQLFGQTLWAARLGIALISLTGFVGAFLLGRALAGRIGALAAVLFLTLDPLFLNQSQTIQAEAPSAALSLLSAGLAYAWWLNPEGLSGLTLAVLCAIALVLSISCKLLGVATLIPIAIIMGMQLYKVLRQKELAGKARRDTIRSVIGGVVAFVLTIAVLYLPFAGAFPQFWQGVVTFHTDASHLYAAKQAQNITIMQGLLTSIMAITALSGTIFAFLRKDWRVIPLLAWTLVTIVMLWLQVPLFHHHLVALIPPMIGLAVLNLDSRLWSHRPWSEMKRITPLKAISLIGVILVVVTMVMNGVSVKNYYEARRVQAHSGLNGQIAAIAADVSAATHPNQFVITDDQFIVAAANRNTPPSLVDTSLVRAQTHYVTSQQLIQAAQDPRVQVVLFYTGRFYVKDLTTFHIWVMDHFHLIKDYGEGRQLWARS